MIYSPIVWRKGRRGYEVGIVQEQVERILRKNRLNLHAVLDNGLSCKPYIDIVLHSDASIVYRIPLCSRDLNQSLGMLVDSIVDDMNRRGRERLEKYKRLGLYSVLKKYTSHDSSHP